MKFKNGISPVVAIALLLVVSVVAVVSLQGWFDTYSSGIYGNVEIQSQSSTESVSIETVVGDQLYVKGDNISVKQVLIDGVECDISANISGVENISLSECLNSATSKTPEVTIITGDKVISKKVYLPDVRVISSSSQSSSVSPVYTDTFISVWNTSESGTSGNTQIALPLESDGNYDFYVTGDNLIGSPVHIQDYENNILNFSSEGLQEISITGTIKGFNFNTNGGDKLKLYEIKAWGPLNVGNNGAYFRYCSNFDFTGSDSLNLEGTEDLDQMFAHTSFNGNISNWDVSQVTDMSYMFYETDLFNQSLNDWDVSNVVNMQGTFTNSIFNNNIGDWVTSSVEDMSWMFSGAVNFNSELNGWDVSNVTNMDLMFCYAYSFNQDLSSWDVSSVLTMSEMFEEAYSFNGNIGDWVTSSVEDMSWMFSGAVNFNQNLSGWDVSHVIDMNGVFYNASYFNGDISGWDVSSVTDMGDMFGYADNFNNDISSWNVSSVRNMRYMFGYTDSFNNDIGSWNVSSATEMTAMFREAISFNQNLSSWDVDQVIYCSSFDADALNWTLNRPDLTLNCLS